MSSLREIFEAELSSRGLSWCRACCDPRSHSRGFVDDAAKHVVHLDSEIATRSSLHRGLHEIAHAILDETGLRRYARELQANRWAETRMREIGVPVPRTVSSAGRAYVGRMKRWGDNIRKGRSRS